MAEKASADSKQALKGPQEVMDAEHDQGFRGTKVDPTPNEAYTVAGVLKGAPTPETDEKAADEAKARQADLAGVEAGKPADK
jgi:hypothetical protein